MLDEIGLLEVSLVLVVFGELAFFLFLLYDFVYLFAFVDVFGVKVFDFLFLFQFHFQLLLFHSFLMGQSFSEMVPLELRQVLDVPDVLRVKVMFFLYHLLPI